VRVARGLFLTIPSRRGDVLWGPARRCLAKAVALGVMASASCGRSVHMAPPRSEAGDSPTKADACQGAGNGECSVDTLLTSTTLESDMSLPFKTVHALL
jgi:hypothetical protein